MSEPGAARTILFFHIISARPSKQPRRVRTFLKVHARPRLANPLRCRGTESSTNKQHISLRRLHPTPEEDLDNEGHVIQTCASASAVHERSLSSLLTVPHPGRPESFRLCFRLGPMQLALSHVHPTARKLSFGPEPLAGTTVWRSVPEAKLCGRGTVAGFSRTVVQNIRFREGQHRHLDLLREPA
jgi:hypothetical protein